MQRLRPLFLIVILIGVAAPNLLASTLESVEQASSDNRSYTVTPLSAYLPEDELIGEPAFSPDFSQIAYYVMVMIDGEIRFDLCIRQLINDEPTCVAFDILHSNLTTPRLLWSPNGRFIAFSDGNLRANIEPDTWVLNTESMTFSNLTDDGFAGEFTLTDFPYWRNLPSVNLDIAFQWTPNNKLVVWRVVAETDIEFNAMPQHILAIDPEIGVEALLHDMTGIQHGFDVFLSCDFDSATSCLFLSPDGSQLVYAVLTYSNPSQIGLYMLDLTANTPPQRIMTNDDMIRAIPLAQYEELSVYSVAWQSDGNLVVFAGEKLGDEIGFFRTLYTINMNNGSVTPLIDFNGNRNRQEFLLDDSPLARMMPNEMIVLPDGTLLTIHIHSSTSRHK